ncbi:MAG: hypothetical protein LUG50_03390 [Planctomycetaceae bacterium]|nr:hypothetical protein [Planctomycetaceae bacterium]
MSSASRRTVSSSTSFGSLDRSLPPEPDAPPGAIPGDPMPGAVVRTDRFRADRPTGSAPASWRAAAASSGGNRAVPQRLQA